MTSDIKATCEVLEEALGAIEQGDVRTAMHMIRNARHFLEDLDTIQWVTLKADETGLSYDKDALPEPDAEVLVTAEPRKNKERYVKLARWSPVDGWHGNTGTAKIVAWAYVEPCLEDANE